jgi:WD40 repeat protein
MSKIKHLKKNTLFFLFVILSLFSLIIFSGCVEIYERSPVLNLSFSPDGQYLLSSDEKPYIQVWNISSGEEVNGMEIFDGYPIIWLPDSKSFLIGEQVDGAWQCSLYDALSFDRLKSLPLVSGIFATQDIGIITTSLDGSKYKVSVWNLECFSLKRTLNITSYFSTIAPAPTGSLIAYIPKEADSIQVIDTKNETFMLSSEPLEVNLKNARSSSQYFKLKWSNDGNTIALLTVFENEWQYFQWEAETLALKESCRYSLIGQADLSPDCTKFIFNSPQSNNVELIDAISGSLILSLEVPEGDITAMTWSSTVEMIAAGSKGIIRIWNATTGSVLQIFTTPKNRIVPT